ncbi:hypothetical protein QAD02_007351 [Eretmocerus hayati]|uniref:Uncharacterized protein n=1 Tax=Eretmocerus hayati TaxID=131215 RepID=A0ACC2N5T2_9HYME|nr:hypothetical protein QAD02_007351 [Eretmocerus hayati]
MRARREERNNIVLRGLQPRSENIGAEIPTWLAANLQVDAQVVDTTVIKPLRRPELIIAKLADADAKRNVMLTKKSEASRDKLLDEKRPHECRMSGTERDL